MKKSNDTNFTVKEQFTIMIIFLLLSIIIVTIAYCSVGNKEPDSNNTQLPSEQSSLSSEISDNYDTSTQNVLTSEISEISETYENSDTSVDESGHDEVSQEERNLEEISEPTPKEIEESETRLENQNYAKTFYSKETDEISHHIEDFPSLCQWPTLPTGCETVSLTSVLNYFGFDVSMTDMADNYLPINNDMVNLGDFRYEFLGDPYEYSGFGCLAPCIETTAYNYFSANNITDYTVADITGTAPQELYNLIAQDIPVVVWVTTRWVDPYIDASWEGRNGEIIDWPFPEHCLVLTGYDKYDEMVIVSDVDSGYEYSVYMPTFESVYTQMGSNAVVILEK